MRSPARPGTPRARRSATPSLDTLAEYAPNIRERVLHRQVLTPLDLEREFSLSEGNIFHGELTPDQLFLMRPAPGWARYRTPIDGPLSLRLVHPPRRRHHGRPRPQRRAADPAGPAEISRARTFKFQLQIADPQQRYPARGLVSWALGVRELGVDLATRRQIAAVQRAAQRSCWPSRSCWDSAPIPGADHAPRRARSVRRACRGWRKPRPATVGGAPGGRTGPARRSTRRRSPTSLNRVAFGRPARGRGAAARDRACIAISTSSCTPTPLAGRRARAAPRGPRHAGALIARDQRALLRADARAAAGGATSRRRESTSAPGRTAGTRWRPADFRPAARRRPRSRT